MSKPHPRTPTTLQYALLGLLGRRSLTGYEILKRFTRSVVFFWNARQSQVYAALDRMEQLGLVTSRVVVQQQRPNRRHYTMTAAGRAALHGWLEGETPAQPVKDEMLLRVFFSDPLPARQVAASLLRHGKAHERVRAEFEAIRTALEERYGPIGSTADRPLAFRYLVLEQGIRFERMYADWCRWAAGALERVRVRDRAHTPALTGADVIVSAAE